MDNGEDAALRRFLSGAIGLWHRDNVERLCRGHVGQLALLCQLESGPVDHDCFDPHAFKREYVGSGYTIYLGTISVAPRVVHSAPSRSLRAGVWKCGRNTVSPPRKRV